MSEISHEQDVMRTKSTSDLPVTIYEPRQPFSGFFSAARLAAREVSKSQFLIWRLFVRDFVAQFRQKVLGYAWAFLNPLLAIISFIVMNASGILRAGDPGVPYPVYVFVGVSLWGFLTTSMTAVSNGLLTQSDLILRTNIPKIALAVSSLSQIVYNLLVHVVLLFLMLLVFQVEPSLLFPLYAVLALPLIVLGASVGLILSVLGAIARDLLPVTQAVLNLVMFLTPVVYVARSVTSGPLHTLIWWNPLTYLIEVPRSILLFGTTDLWWAYLLVCGLCAGFLLLSIKCFYLMQDLIAERL